MLKEGGNESRKHTVTEFWEAGGIREVKVQLMEMEEEEEEGMRLGR